MLSADPIPAHAPPPKALSAKPTEGPATPAPSPTLNHQPPTSTPTTSIPPSPSPPLLPASSPPHPLAPLFNLSKPLSNSDLAELLPAFTDPANQPYLDDHEKIRAYRIQLALDDALLHSIQTLVDVQNTSTNDADRRRAATVIVHLFKSNSRTQRTTAAAGALPPPASSTAPLTPRHLDTSTPSYPHSAAPPLCHSATSSSPLTPRHLGTSTPWHLDTFLPHPHDTYTPKPSKHGSLPPCDVELPPPEDLSRITGGPPHPYNLTSPPPDTLPPPPPDATPRDVVRAQLRAVRASFRGTNRHTGAVPAIFASLAPSLQAHGLDTLQSLLYPGFCFSCIRTTIAEPVYAPISNRPVSDCTDSQLPSSTASNSDHPLHSATVLITRHRPHCDSSVTFHLIQHNPTTDPAHPQPPIWLLSHIQPTGSDTS